MGTNRNTQKAEDVLNSQISEYKKGPQNKEGA